jgi:hypothetical protein
MTGSGVRTLECDYFAAVCRDALGGYLKAHGFEEVGLTRGGNIVFGKGDEFIEFGYDLDFYPEYSLTSVVGIGSDTYHMRGGVSGIPLWSLVPDSHPFRASVHWTFRDRPQLLLVLRDLRVQLLDPVVMPMLSDPAAVEGLRKLRHP